MLTFNVSYTTEYKICPVCKESKKLVAYTIRTASKDGRHTQCRLCKNRLQNEKRSKRKDNR